jgi:Flp pilus assembly protein TadG
MHMIAPIVRLLRCTKGNAALEMAIVFPIFVTLIGGISQYGLAIFQIMEVGYAAQAGANYAMTNGFNVSGIETAVTKATALPNVSATRIPPSQACGCASTTGISSATCGTTCPGTGAGSAGTYVTVSASVAYSPVLPGIPSPITAKAVVRIN